MPADLSDSSLILAGDTSMDTVGVVQKAAKGVVSLGFRQVLVYAANICGSVILARILPTDQFGYYSVLIFFLNFLAVFGGTGFAANLIRLPVEPTLKDKRAVFTSQQIVILLICIAAWVVSPRLAHAYHLELHGTLYFRLISLSLFFTSFMVIPQVQMERHLDFSRLAIIEVIQALIFNITAVLCSLKHLGPLSFALALAIRTLVGAVLAMFLSPWKMGFEWRREAVNEHLHFGLALQAGQLITLAKDSLIPVFVGIFLGASDVGYITWAAFVAGYAVIVLFPLQRIYLPLFSKFQHNKVELRKFLGQTIWLANVVAAPLTIVTLALLHPITQIIFGAKWLYALPLVYCFALGNLFVPPYTPMLAALNAVGRSKTTLWLTLITLIAMWGFGVPLIMAYGVWGFGYALICANVTHLILFWVVWKELGLVPWGLYLPSWPLAIAFGSILFGIQRRWPPHSVIMLAVAAVTFLLIYCAGMWACSSRRIRSIIAIVRADRKTPSENLSLSMEPPAAS